jgi:putative nucleotidyltransferase with HDIG domain
MLLGVGRIRSLALTVHVFSAFNTVHFPPGTVETIWDHSLRVGRLAERIAQMEGADPIFVEQAFTAGLLHDCGKLVLADMIDGRYAEVISRSVEEKRSMVDTEMEMLHASHADVGGYLLDLWGLPSALVESVAFHHDPGQSLHAGFNPLTVVYVANILDHLDSQLPTNQVLARFDMDYLRKVNVDQKIEHWVKQLAAS